MKIDTGTEDLLGRIDGHVAVLSFNRPERRNALSAPMYGALDRVLPQLAGDPSVRVLLLTGEGGAFCAGGDVKGMHENNTAAGSADGSCAARAVGRAVATRAAEAASGAARRAKWVTCRRVARLRRHAVRRAPASATIARCHPHRRRRLSMPGN